MQKRNILNYSLIVLILISSLILPQCSNKGTNNQTPGNVGMDLKLTPSALLQMASQLHILITAEDMDTIEVFIPLSEEDGYIYSQEIEVPAGLDRLFVVEVLDADGVVLYRGEETADVGDGVNIELPIFLEPQVSLMKLNPRFNHKMANSLLNLTFEVFYIEGLYEIVFRVYYDNDVLEFIDASIDPSINESTTDLFYSNVYPPSSGLSYILTTLKGTNYSPIVDAVGNGQLVNFVFRCKEITNPVESTYLFLDYITMRDPSPSGFPPLLKDPLMIDSSLVKIVTDIIIEGDTIPDVPNLLSPANNAENVSLSPLLQWSSAEHAQLYNLVLATDVSFENVYVSPQYIDDTSYQAAELSDNTTYYWQVQSLNDAGMSDWSETWSFTTLDNTAPSAIADLLISDTSGTSATLTWTAPGDNGNTGTAASYDIRYANNLTALQNWNSATQVSNELVPQVAGSNETLTVTNLELENWYYFGIKSMDDAGIVSPLSNIDSIYLSSGFTVIPTGFAIDYNAMGLNWKADWNTRVISFTWTITGIGFPDGFKIYAKDNKTNTTYVEVADVPYQDLAAQQTATVTLPAQFDSNVGDALITPFSNGTVIDFDVRAYKNTFGDGDFSGSLVSIGDQTPPVFNILQTYGDADNTNGEGSFDVDITLDRQLEYCLTTRPTFSFIENGGDENYILPPASVAWTWDSTGRKDEYAYITVPQGKCGAGDLFVVTIRDNSNNAFSDTLRLLPIITVTMPNSSVTEFEAPLKYITWTFSKPAGTNYSNRLNAYLSLDGGNTISEYNFDYAYDTDLSAAYLISDSLMSENARIGLANTYSGNIWWSEPFQLNGIKLMHPDSSDIDSYEVIYDRGNTDSTMIPMSWNSVGIDNFIIWYSYDYGESWNALDTVSNTSSYELYLPNRGVSYSAFLKVTDADTDNRPESIFDYYGYGIYVNHDTLYPSVPEPGSWIYAGYQQLIEWYYTGTSNDNIILQYSTDKGESWNNIATTTNDGSYLWNIPGYESSLEEYLQIRFRDRYNLNTLGVLDRLTLVGLTLEYPNGGETFTGGNVESVVFSIMEPYGYEVIDIYISITNWADSEYVGYGDYGGTGSWTVP
ncbi:MAG: hypothetical protein ABIJ12_02875, partial [bacterium]